jgi:hypothetical protein
MAPALVIGLKKDDELHLYLTAAAEMVRIGIGVNPQTTEFYPDIEILYPAAVLPHALKIAQEMEKLNLFPEVFLEPKPHTWYVAVVFCLKPVSEELVKNLMPTSAYPDIQAHVQAGKTQLIMTGECEYAKEDLSPFLSLYQQFRHFKLLLLNTERRPIWGVQLSHFKIGSYQP